MQPTMKLRWLKRKCKNLPPEFNALSQNANEIVLQQWWTGFSEGKITLGFGTGLPISVGSGEWRDIEIAEEELP